MAKTKNPFKMKGSWIGVVFYAIWFFAWWIFGVDWDKIFGLAPSIFLGEFFDHNLPFLVSTAFSMFTTLILLNVIVFFLIGWGIHSLVRKMRK